MQTAGRRLRREPMQPPPGRSVKSLLAEFEILRSAAIRGVEDGAPHGPTFDEKYAYVDDLCVARFNKQIDELDRWRSSQIVGFSAARFRAEAREAELNQAMMDLNREEFVTGVFDLKSLFSVLFDGFYSEDIVQWLGAVESNGRVAVFQRMAAALEPMHTLLETGPASIAWFRAP